MMEIKLDQTTLPTDGEFVVFTIVKDERKKKGRSRRSKNQLTLEGRYSQEGELIRSYDRDYCIWKDVIAWDYLPTSFSNVQVITTAIKNELMIPYEDIISQKIDKI